MAKLAGVIQAVSDDELVLNLESDIFNGDVDLAPARLAQQAGRAKRPGVARAEDILEIAERQARIDDVLDDNDVSALEGRVEIFEKTDLAGAFCRRSVAGDGDEIECDRARRDRSGQIGQKHESALQHGDKMKRLLVRVVRIDARGHFGDARTDLLCSE